MNKLVSVIIPTYNRAKIIKKSIDSVLAQTYQDIEIIIVDDGSKDNTKELIESLNNPKIKYFYQENAGASAARNTGIKNASGQFIAFLDSDDVWLSEKLEKQLDVFKNNENIDIVYSGFKWIEETGDKYEINRFKNYKTKKEFAKFLLCNMLPICPIVMIKKSVFDNIGVFDENLIVAEDWEFCLRALPHHNFYYIDEVLTHFYRNNKSLSATADIEKMKKTHLDVLERFFALKDNYKNYGIFKNRALSHQYFVFALMTFYRARNNQVTPPVVETIKYTAKGFCFSPAYYFSKKQILRFIARVAVYSLCRI